MKRCLAVSALLFLAILLRSSPGQQSDRYQAKGQSPLQHEVTVALKLIQVYVTDKKGNPIPDLRKDEFVLYDNKDEKTITEFERHALSLPGTSSPAPAAKPELTAVEPKVPLLNRKFFMLFDLVFTRAKGFRIARSAALRFLESGLIPTDEASVLLYAGGRNLEVRKLPTLDHDAVRAAVESLTIADLLDRHFDESETVGPQILSGQDTPFSAMSRPSSSGGPSEIRILAGNFIWALKSFAQALRSQPGQKHVVLYSKGIASATIGRGQGGGTYSELSRGYAAMCKELAAAGVSVFPVNTADPDAFKMSFGTGETTLRETAASTGGRYLGFAVNTEKLMETLNNITGMYYVLGYPVSQAWDGKFHTVRIKVTRPDCEVHAQPGYFNPKPFAEYSKIEKEIHLVDLALSDKPLSQDPARFAMQAFPIACSPKGNLLLVAEIPRWTGGIEGPKIEVSSLVFNGLDEIVDTQRIPMDLAAGRSDPRSRFLLTSLSAPPGTYKCRVILRDVETGTAAVAGASAIVPENPGDKLLLLPPLLVTEDSAALLLSGNQTDQGRPADSRTAQRLLFDLENHAPLLGNELAAGTAIGAVIRCSAPGDDISGLELSAHLDSQASGQSREIRPLILGKRAEKTAKAFLVGLEIPQVAPGPYKLVLTVNDTRSGQSSRISRNFLIK
jgi:VWFA-related protein